MKFCIVGGAGFIGSYIVDHLLSSNIATEVVVYDNFSAGKRWHLKSHINDKRLKIIARDIYDPEIFSVISGKDVTILLAANPDIAKAATEPDIDFKQGTALTQIVLEAMRKGGCRRLLYSSGSGVYGDAGAAWIEENFSPMEPVSTYGASKLACEALISSYCHMFDFTASCFRFGNVVGGRQTHGVAYDFIRKLTNNSNVLDILGDGSQSKPYIFVDDVISAVMLIMNLQKKKFDVYNVAPEVFLSVTEIAMNVLNELKINSAECKLLFGTESKGWKGDVPVVRLVTRKIRSMGWSNKYSSSEAVTKSVQDMLSNIKYLFNHA